MREGVGREDMSMRDARREGCRTGGTQEGREGGRGGGGTGGGGGWRGGGGGGVVFFFQAEDGIRDVRT